MSRSKAKASRRKVVAPLLRLHPPRPSARVFEDAAKVAEAPHHPPLPAKSDVESILRDRGNQYGRFDAHARLAQTLKGYIYEHKGRNRFTNSQCEAIDMICHKLARIANGNPNLVDSWEDIAGYATLEAKILKGIPL